MVRASVMFQVILGEWSLLRRPSVCLLQRRVGIFNGLYFQDQRVQDLDWYFFSKFQTSMGLDWESSAKYDRLSRGRTWWHTKDDIFCRYHCYYYYYYFCRQHNSDRAYPSLNEVTITKKSWFLITVVLFSIKTMTQDYTVSEFVHNTQDQVGNEST